ncbi:MurR/RpiR family transcriptional regulator [Lacibacterium aquatile]|uniref:MurR/RpiR family transcriptional regulator n=1 Tax=Lacibacterium aquatile TaxID=1168082 RepID=A0ABW5DVT7_9PROT
MPPKPASASTAPASLEGVIRRLEALKPSLSPVAARLADFIITNAHSVVHMSVTEVAEQAGSSEGSVISLCQRMGAKGFQQLKISLARELVQPIKFIHEDLERNDPVDVVVEKVFASGMQALQDTLKVLDMSAMARAVDIILKAKRIEVYGIGSAASIAEDAHYRMLRIGLDCKAVVDSHIQAISASLTGPDVAVITVTHSGATHETLAATRLAKEAGASTICITNFGKSPIQAYADVLLQTMARETQFRTEAMTSRIAQLGIVDALIAALALARHDKSVETIAKTFDVLSIKRF